MEPPRYQYQSLSETNSIRLLHIRHDPSRSHNLWLSLHAVSLDSNPQFCALSYTWKSPVYAPRTANTLPQRERYYDVECDEQIITVSENLFHFFQTVVSLQKRHCQLSSDDPQDRSLTPTPDRLKKSRPDSKSKRQKFEHLLATHPIWIDALCINQSDPSERQSQVLLMHKIYSLSKHILVWLGPSKLDPRSSVLWVHDVFIPVLAKLCRSDPDLVATRLAADPLCETRVVVDRIGGPICSQWAASWLGFANFLDRHRWFDRGWVVQEVALGQPHAISVLCGSTELSWMRLSAFSKFLHQTGWAQSLRNKLNSQITRRASVDYDGAWWTGSRWVGSASRRPIGCRIRAMEDIRGLIGLGKGAVEGKDAMRLWALRASSLVGILRSSEFEDHRDHVYGALGMLSQLLPDGMESPITPDYGMTTEEVYTAVVSTFISWTGSLFELSQVEDRRHRRYSGLPSWVPDYSVYPGDSHQRRSRPDSSLVLLHDGLGRQSNHVLPPTISGWQLTVYGIRIDRRAKGTLCHDRNTRAFRDNLLNLLLAATTIHTTTMASDFFTTLTRGNPASFLHSTHHDDHDMPTTKPPSSDEDFDKRSSTSSAFPPGTATARSTRGEYSGSTAFLGALESDWLSTSQPIPFASLAQKCQDEQITELVYRRSIARQASDPESKLSEAVLLEAAIDPIYKTYDYKRDRWGYKSFLTFLNAKASGNRADSVEAMMLLGQLVQIHPAAPMLGSDRLEEEVWGLLGEGLLCATEKGRLGFAPVSCLEGDEVWLLGGARTPVLLRKAKDKAEESKGGYTFIGEIYISGVDVNKTLMMAGKGEGEKVVLI